MEWEITLANYSLTEGRQTMNLKEHCLITSKTNIILKLFYYTIPKKKKLCFSL